MRLWREHGIIGDGKKVKGMAMGIGGQDAVKDKITGTEEVEALGGCEWKGSCLRMLKLPRVIIKSLVGSILRAIVFKLSLQNLCLKERETF